MASKTGATTRLLLYLDLQGFGDMVARGTASHVGDVIRALLRQATNEAEKRSLQIGSVVDVIYFSDTIVLYTKATGFSPIRYRHMRLAATALWRALMADQIPASAVITYGDFVVEMIDDLRSVYYGQALIEAYKAEKDEKWLGVIVCPSAAKKMPDLAKDGERDGSWRLRRDSSGAFCLLLNPFLSLCKAFKRPTRPEAFAELSTVEQRARNALFFIHSKAQEFAKKADFASSVAVRYHATVAFARSVLGEDCYQWAVKLRDQVAVRNTRHKKRSSR